MAVAFEQIENSSPYPWPLAGQWHSDDTALIVIDMQRDFLAKGGYFDSLGEDISLGQAAVGPASQLLAMAREYGLLTVLTRESHRPDLRDLNENKRLKGERLGAAPGTPGPMGRLLVRGEFGCDLIEEFQPQAGEIVLDKPGNSSFYATDLEQILRANGIKNLILCGVTTDVCVSSTLRDANDRGFDSLLVRDACGAATLSVHNSVFESMDREGGIFGAWADSSMLNL